MKRPLFPMLSNRPHIPVLLSEVLNGFSGVESGVIVDGTFGAGGYAAALLDVHPNVRVIAFDRDPTVQKTADEFSEKYGARFRFINDNFGNMAKYLPGRVDGIVLDLGVSSMQIDTPARGFSFRFDGPLDMRMGGQGISAADIVNTYSEEQIANILYQYGEEKASRRIAREIVQARKVEPIRTTARLADIIHGVMPRPKDGSDSAARSFQALRIVVNDELRELERALESSVDLLKPGGRLIVVSFHSLEDRIVKNFLTNNSCARVHQNKYAACKPNEESLFRIITRKPIGADDKELDANPRANCAKLRIGERL